MHLTAVCAFFLYFSICLISMPTRSYTFTTQNMNVQRLKLKKKKSINRGMLQEGIKLLTSAGLCRRGAGWDVIPLKAKWPQ